jgi:hypothetical protein
VVNVSDTNEPSALAEHAGGGAADAGGGTGDEYTGSGFHRVFPFQRVGADCRA